MRSWIMLGVGLLLLFTVAVPSGTRGATMDDLKDEMAKDPLVREGKRYVMYVPMMFFNGMHMSAANLCVSGGRLRPIEGVTGTDMGPAPQGNQYSVLVFARDGGGYDTFQYERKVTWPDCK